MTEQDKGDKNEELEETADTESPPSAEEAEAGTEGVDAAEGAEVDETDKTDDEEIDLWAEAMAEQEAQEASKPDEAKSEPDATEAEQPEEEEDDLWAAAMTEQEAASVQEEKPASSAASRSKTTPAAPKQPEAQAAGDRVFRPLENANQGTETRDLAMVLDIPVRLSVELGRTKVTIKQLLEMAQGSVVELDGLAGEPMDILINGYLIAQGEVVVVEDKYGIRITEIVTPSERVQKLNR
ncbi:flagellar motor switch protein FliN [Lamprobacter sp.]|uniref:flagellar motor switch protein FliN n=1 Tax=Lamprobacter sp. TaxID=3100796 RepID=UPI003A4E1CDD